MVAMATVGAVGAYCTFSSTLCLFENVHGVSTSLVFWTAGGLLRNGHVSVRSWCGFHFLPTAVEFLVLSWARPSIVNWFLHGGGGGGRDSDLVSFLSLWISSYLPHLLKRKVIVALFIGSHCWPLISMSALRSPCWFCYESSVE